MQRLFLNNIEIDLGAKKIAQTFQINDLAELKDRNLHFTNRFKIPASPKNILAMEYLGVIGSKSRQPYQIIKAKFIFDGIELISDGYANVRESNESGYEINIYDGNASLYETLKGRRMNDLDYQDLNHALNGSTHLASLDHTSGYIYALGDFGVSTVSGLVNSERQVAALYKHTLFDKILTEAGFTYEGDFLSDPEFLREVVLPTKGYEVVGEDQVETSKGSTSSNTISKNEYSLADPEYEVEQYNLIGAGLIDTSIQSGNVLQFDAAGLYHIQATINYTMTRGVAFSFIKLNGSQTGSTVNWITDALPHSEVVDYFIQAEIGDQVEFWVDHHAQSGTLGFEIDFTSDIDSVITLVTGGMIIKFEDIMPESSQIDFIKDIMQQYGLIFQADKNSNHYKFLQIEDLLNDRSGAEDWSDKMIDNGSEEYTIGKYAQNNWMQYNYADQEVIDTSLDGNMTADHFNLPEEITLFKSIYTISEKTQTRNTIPIYGIWLWESKDEQEGTVINNKEVPFRSFKIKYIDEAVTFQFGSVVGNYSRASNMPFLSLENMDYDYYIANYYPAFQRILNAQKKRIVSMLLKPTDIYNLNFLRLKYIKQLGQYYYLNKVKNFISGSKSQIELIQANELTVNQPPSQLGSNSYTLNHGASKLLTLSDFINTNPIYADPEFDQPETIKILSGFGDEIKIRNNGIEITDSTPFEVATMNISILDDSLNAAEHSNDFTFTIQSFNNSNFSSEIGTLSVLVNAEVNLPPIADAGPNQSIPYDGDIPNSGSISLIGTSSSDPNSDPLTYLWSADSLPANLILTNATSAIATLSYTDLTPAQHNLQITFTLRVTDDELLFNEDTMIVTLLDVF